MLELKNVSRRYGTVEALRDVSFRCPERQIIGLLGVNGAGKTTSLNILTGYLPPTSGRVLVNGTDMLRDPRGCKRQIGYLPEKPPLYDEMTVRDFLVFVCRLKDVAAASLRAHVDDLLGLCGLEDMAGRVIGHLSKGYRQRVGLAQALCGDPDILVLDEPSVGLDPRQAVEIRQLMRTLGQDHTVVFSSHMLSEIQLLCDRAVILHRGEVIREADMSELTGGEGIRLRLSIGRRASEVVPGLKSLPCVRRVKMHLTRDDAVTETTVECACSEDSEDPRVQVFRLCAGLDAPILLMTPERDTLEDVFLRATSGESL